MVKVHQCEIACEKSIYILTDSCYLEDHYCDSYIYEIQVTENKAEGKRVSWNNCPYCGEKII